MNTHNQCFGAKIRKIGILLHTPFLLHKSGVYVTRECFPDVHRVMAANHKHFKTYREYFSSMNSALSVI